MKPTYQSLRTVTPFSRWLALAMLVVFPVAAFFLGRWYQYITDSVTVIKITDRKEMQLRNLLGRLESCTNPVQATASAKTE